MKCGKCGGLMIVDKIYDPDGQFLHIDVWRCLNCGETLDPTILQARKKNREKGETTPSVFKVK